MHRVSLPSWGVEAEASLEHEIPKSTVKIIIFWPEIPGYEGMTVVIHFSQIALTLR